MKNLYRSAFICLLALGGQFLHANAEMIIYADTFSGTGDLSGATPTTDTGGHGGTAGATWSTPSGIFTEDAGSVSTPDGNTSTSAVLPFTPKSGQIYTLTLTMTSDGGYGAVEFDGSSTGVTTNYWYETGDYSAYDWSINAGYYDQEFAGSGTNGGNTAGTGNGTFVLKLNTTQPTWSYSIMAPGETTPFTGTYSTNPTINGVGLGMLFGAGVTYTSFSLTTNAPEPSTYALLGAGLLCVLFFARRRIQAQIL